MDESEVGPEISLQGEPHAAATSPTRSENLKWWAALIAVAVGTPELIHLARVAFG